MNIIKLQDQLKGMPDDALVGYVQNPTGNVPTYLALSELQRRKDMRSKYQANAPEDKTVAEDLVEEAQPQPGIMGLPEGQPMQQAMQPPPEMPMEQMAQGGLAELDTGDMYDENNYASGGIVAFDDGGYVPGFAGPEGSYVNPGLYGGPTQESLPWYSGINKWLNRNLDWSATNKAMRDKADKGWPNEVSNPFLSGQPRTDIMQEYLDIKQKVATGKGTYQDIERMKQIENQGVPPTREPGGGGWTKEKQAEADAKAAKEKEAQILKDKDNALKNMMNQNAGGAREKIKSLADYANEFRDVVGKDPMQAKLMERLEKMDSRAAKMEEQAPWLALAQAGFEMASSRPEYGKGQSAFADIARGATAGVKSFSDARDKMATLEEKRFGLMADMAKAQRAEQLAIASKGADSRDAQLAREQQYKIHQQDQELKLKLHVLDNSVELQKAQMTMANKDLPNAVERATKIDPLIVDDKDYKAGLKALEDKYGDKGVIPGSPNYDKYEKEVDALYRKIYAKKIRNPLAASSFGSGALNYTPGKGYY